MNGLNSNNLNKNKMITKKRINKQIKIWQDEIAESVDDVNVQTKDKPLTAEQIVKIGKAIEWYKSKIEIDSVKRCKSS